MHLDTVRKLRSTDVDPTARLLAGAFFDNAFYSFLHPGASTRRADLESFFRRNLVWHEPLDLTWVACDASGDVIGTATLEPPGGVPATPSSTLSHWVVPTVREHGLGTVARLAWADAAFARHNRATAGQRSYWHVHAVAVHPRAQGRGVGLGMMRHVLGELDAMLPDRPTPVVLSTQREVNLRFYGALGFETMKRVTMRPIRPSRGFETWFLRRRA